MTTTGPNLPGTAADDSAVGSAAWFSPNDGKTDNGIETANLDIFSGQTTHYLKMTNFGFAIADTQIDGIQVLVQRRSLIGVVKDSVVKLVVGGSVVGSNKADSGTNWPGSVTDKTYGGPADLWGITPAVADVNGATFGMVVSAVWVSGSGKPSRAVGAIDYISITVTSSSGGAAGQPTTKRFGGVPFMGAHGSGLQAPVRQWMRRDSGLIAPQVATGIWRPAHG